MSTPEVALQKLMHAFTVIPFNKMLGLSLQQLNGKEVTMQFAMKPDLIGNFLHGILHGGVISSVLDMAGGMVVMSAALAKHGHLTSEELVAIISKTSTIDLQVSYLRPGKGELFIARAFLLKSGKHVSFTRMELLNQTQELIATGNASYLVK